MTTTFVLDDLERLAARVGVDATEAEKLANDVKAWDTLDAARKTEITQLVESVAESAGKQLDDLMLELPDVLGDARTGLLVPELQHSFRRWRYRNSGKGVEDWLDELAAHPTRRQRVLVHALLGSDFTRAVTRSAIRSPKVTSNWPGLNWLVLRANPPSTSALASGARSLPDKVADVIGQYPNKLTGDAATQAARVEKLLKRLVDSGNLDDMTEAGMQRILGTKSVHDDELAALLVQGMNWAELEAANWGRTVDELLDIEGIEYFFQDLLTRGGYQHGSRFELRCLGRELESGVDTTSLRLQVPMLDSRKGPDIVRYLTNSAQLVQAKSFTSLTELIRESTNAVIFDQLLRDLTRLGEQGFKVASNPPSTSSVKLGSEIVFRVDLLQLYRKYDGELEDLQDEAVEAVDAMADQVNAWLKLPSTKAQLGMSASASPFQLTVEVL